jgi:hypothetical protein
MLENKYRPFTGANLDWQDLMNEEMTSSRNRGTETTDATANTNITDYTQVASCAVGRDRQEQRRRKIREELVREHFAEGSDPSRGPQSLRHRLLQMLKFN